MSRCRSGWFAYLRARSGISGPVLIFAVVALIISPLPAKAASSWRCGSHLVGRGTVIGEVYDLCGEPMDRSTSTEFVTVRLSCDVAVTRAVQLEAWVYNNGREQFMRYLTFRDGILVGIDEGGYGY